MRKSTWIAAAAAALAGAVLWFSFAGSSAKPEGTLSSGESTSATASASRASGQGADELEWQHPTASAQELAMPGGTPALKRPATEADGQFEIAVSASGYPAASARVRVYLRGPRDPSTGEVQWRFAGGGATGPDGKLKVPARAGAYLLAARAGGFAPVRKEAARAGGEKLTRVELTLEPGLSLRGGVVEKGREGAGVPMAELTLTAAANGLSGDASAPAEEKIHATADPRGHFEIAGLSRGSYRLDARAPGRGKAWKMVTVPRPSELVIGLGAASFIQGHVVASDGKPAAAAEVAITGSGDPEVVTAGPQGDFSAEVNPGTHQVSARSGAETGSLADGVSVAAGMTRDVVVQLGEAAAITGLVRSKKTRAPVAGAVVGLSPYNEAGDSGHATAGPNGRFKLEPLAPGAYDLVVAAEGYTDLMKKGVTIAAGQQFSLTLEVEGTGCVEGTVRDPSGAPIAGAVVQGGEVWGGPFTTGVSAEARTDSEGRYRIGGLCVGRVRLSAGRKPGAWLGGQGVDVREGETAHVDLTLEGSGTVEGRVTARGGGPLERAAEVRAFPLAGPGDLRIAQVEPDGRYRLELATGQYSLVAYFPDDGPRFTFNPSAPVKVEPGAVAEEDLEISGKPEPAIAGQVLEPDGSPSTSAMVGLSVPGSSGPISAFSTDDSGHFELSRGAGAAAGAYAIHAINGGRTGELPSVRPGTEDAVVILRPGGTVIGHIVPAGAPPESYRVEVEPLEAGLPSWALEPGQEFTGDRFELHEVPALEVRFRVTAADGRTGIAVTTVPPGGRAEVSIALETGVTLSGRAVGPDHAPVPVAMAILDQLVFSQPTGTDGRFKLEDVSAGKRTLELTGAFLRSKEQEVTVSPGQDLDVGDVVMESIRAEPGTWARPSPTKPAGSR